MAHMIESMFSANRVVPWHYEMTKDVTKLIQEAPTSKDALHLAGLDWAVDQTEVYTENGILIPGYKANRRSTDGSILGIVSDKYKVVQNTEAFEFTDAIVGETEDGVVKYETAGSLCGGKRIWLLAKMPTQKVLDDDVDPYMFFANSHDGTGAIKVGMTPVRIVCNNTLSLALNTAKRSWSTKHIGNMQSKLEEAKLCLQMASVYMTNLDIEADRLANAKLHEEEIEQILDEMFPVNDKTTERKKSNILQFKQNFWKAYDMPDITKFGSSAWRGVNAMSDVITHAAPTRNTATYNENRWGKIMDGHILLDQFTSLVNKKIAA